jgi:hypothetical protein
MTIMRTDGLRISNAYPADVWTSVVNIGVKVEELGIQLESTDHTNVCIWMSAANVKKLIKLLEKKLEYHKL